MKFIRKFLIRWASPCLIAFGAATSNAQSVHIAHCLYACPTGEANSNEIVVRHLFAASINGQTGLADWVAYRVLRDTIGVASLLPRLWKADDLLLQDSASLQLLMNEPGFTQPDLSDQQDRAYRFNEISINPEDRGRLVPLTSFAGTPYWDELNYISNLAPLPVELRTGSWSRLDQSINDLASRIGEVFVVSGPLYQIQQPLSTNTSIAANRPTAYFKVVASTTALAAFVFREDLESHANFCDQQSSLQQIEQTSELTLFPQIQDITFAELHTELGCVED